MKAPSPRPAAVADVLGDVLKRIDPEQQLRAYGIWTFWNDEVGATIARRAQPTRFRNGILFVTVATHSWLQELQFMKATIRDRLNARLGTPLVRDLLFVSGRVDGEPAAVSPPSPDSPSAAVTVPDAGPCAVLPASANAELAAAFQRIVAARAKRLASLPRRTRR